MESAKLSKKYQIVVPREIRRQMKLQAGSRITIHTLDEGRALLLKHPESRTEALRGLGKDVWQAVGGGARYIKQERSSWHKKSASIR